MRYINEQIKTFDKQGGLKKLAERKTLKSVELSKTEGDSFIIGKTLNKIRLKQYHFKTSDELPLLSDRDREFLEKEIDKKCLDWLRKLWDDSSCYQDISRAYIDQIKKDCITAKNFSDKIALFNTLQKIKSTGVTITFQLTLRCHE